MGIPIAKFLLHISTCRGSNRCISSLRDIHHLQRQKGHYIINNMTGVKMHVEPKPTILIVIMPKIITTVTSVKPS